MHTFTFHAVFQLAIDSSGTGEWRWEGELGSSTGLDDEIPEEDRPACNISCRDLRAARDTCGKQTYQCFELQQQLLSDLDGTKVRTDIHTSRMFGRTEVTIIHRNTLDY